MRSSDWISYLASRIEDSPILFTGGMELQTSAIDQLASEANRPDLSYHSIHKLRDRANWAKWARRSNLIWPTTYPFPLSCPFPMSSGKVDLVTSWLVKSTHSVGGSHVCDWNEQDQGCPLDSNAANVYLQEKVQGKSVGVSFLSSEHGSIVVGVAKGAYDKEQSFMPRYAYRGSFGPIPIDSERVSKLLDFACNVWIDTGVRGLWQADFILTKDSLALIEINPRWSASMELLDWAFHVELVALHANCVRNAMSALDWRIVRQQLQILVAECPSQPIGKMIVYAEQALWVSQSKSDAWSERQWRGQSLEDFAQHGYFLADIPVPGTWIEPQQPVLTAYILDGSAFDPGWILS
jgi:uncharacterized protein